MPQPPHSANHHNASGDGAIHRANIQTIVLDPELDGSGGKELALAEFMELAEELKKND